MLKRGYASALAFDYDPAPSRDLLLNGTAYGREDVVGITAHQTYGAHYDHQNDRQHHRVFSDVLTVIVMPQITHDTHHASSLSMRTKPDCARLIRGSLWSKDLKGWWIKQLVFTVIACDFALAERPLSSNSCGTQGCNLKILKELAFRSAALSRGISASLLAASKIPRR